MQKKLLLLFGLFLFLISGCGILNNENPKNDLNKGTLNVFFSCEEKEGEEISLKLYKKELDKVFELNNQQTEVTFPLDSGLRVMELVVKINGETIKTRILECEILKGGNKQVEITVSRNSSGGVAITFDDKFVDNWYSAKDLFLRNNAKVTFFVSYFDKLTKEELNKLKSLQRDGHEIASHGFRHKNAVNFVEKDSIKDYLEEEIYPSIEAMVEKGFKKPQTFAYPFGARNREIDNALLKYFVSLRGVTYTGSDGCISNLDRAFFSGSSRKVFFGVGIDRIYGNSVETIIEGLRRAKKENEVLILYGHKISKDPGEYVINPQKLKKILDFVHSTEKLCFYNISDLGDFDSTRYNFAINKCQQNKIFES